MGQVEKQLSDRSCFVIMPISSVRVRKRTIHKKDFDFLMNSIIAPVLSSLGYKAIRADSVNSTGSIIKDIVSYIVSSDLSIVDLTGLNPNVLYELGVRHALSNRTILLTQDLRSLPFDLKDLRTIEYSLMADGPESLRTRLTNIVAGLESGNNEVIDNPVLEYLSTYKKSLLPPIIQRAASIHNYITPPEERMKQEIANAEDMTNRLMSQCSLIPDGEVMTGLRDYEIREIATLFNVSPKVSHQRLRAKRMIGRPFHMNKYPVTCAEYQLFILDTKHTPPESWKNGWYYPFSLRDHPVTGVNFTDAMEYCQWLTRTKGHSYRLPTESEWEMAARKSMDIVYPWGDTISADNCNCDLANRGCTTSVFAYERWPSQCGLIDMAGNTWEWCELDKEDQSNFPARNAILKGGSYESTIFEVKVGYREVFNRHHSHQTIGFRVVKSD